MAIVKTCSILDNNIIKDDEVIRMETVSIGVFGGSGFYKFGENVKELKIDTPYGIPSSPVFLASIEGKRVAFLPRHGTKHDYPPHKINYRANLWAMKELGVKRIFGPCAAGSLQVNVKPGEIVFCDQFVDRTNGRADTFYDGPMTTHISCAEPYCPDMRRLAINAAKELKLPHHETGTVVVINGPRFSSKAESKWFTNQGWEVVNMSQYPEAVLARELEMCYVNISLITDYDCGLESEVAPTNVKDIITVFDNNLNNLKKLLFKIIKDMPDEHLCDCDKTLKFSRFNG